MSEPAYTLRLEPRPCYLYARVDGPADTLAVSMAYWAELEAACRAGGVTRLLVEECLAGNADPADMEEMVERLVTMDFGRIRVAFVDATEDAALLVGAEVRAARAGLVGRVFRRVDEAEAWLLQDGPASREDAPAAAPVPAG